MKKKILAAVASLAIMGMSSMALAEIAVDGQIAIRSRNFTSMNFQDSSKNAVDTQEKVILNVSAKASDDLKGKISIWNDFDTWGRLEADQANATSKNADGSPRFLDLREAWVNFNMPGIPVNVTAGHQLLALGNEWFFRSKHFGSDALVVANVTGNNTAAFVNVKASEGNSATADDADAYVLLDMIKLSDAATVGIDITNVKVRPGMASAMKLDGFSDVRGTNLMNIGLNFNGKVGPVNLKAQIDLQSGKLEKNTNNTISNDQKFKGNEIVIQGNVPVNPMTINFMVGRGSGMKSGSSDIDMFVPILDIDPHYTFLYEYKVNTVVGAKNTGLANTTVLSVGAAMDASKSVKVGADLYLLQATEKVTLSDGSTSSAIGTELDVKVNWKMYDNLVWDWNFGYLKAGKALNSASKNDAAMGAQGILTYKF